MPMTVRSLPIDPTTHALRWTREAFWRLVQNQILEGENYELLGGEILRKTKNPPHILTFVLTLQWLSGVFGVLYCQPEGPVDTATIDDEMNLPEPDIAVLTRPLNADRPTPNEVCLIVEIADSTLSRDLGQKAILYARSGIIEYWVVDVTHRRVHLHRSPDIATGTWQFLRVYEEDEQVAPATRPNAFVTVRDLLPSIA